jgi:NAD(P)H dehydrogenase (quinone)
MNVLIVCAHQDARSFNGALLALAERELAAAGHAVEVSDLYAMNFEPRCTAADFADAGSGSLFKYDELQERAHANGGFAPDVAAEIDKLVRADLLILQFPLYWFAMPAILKGWVDRVFVNGLVYGGGKWYDRGGLKGRRAMLTITTGCYPPMCAPDGINGGMDLLLWPIQNGILRFAGMAVLPPFIAYAVARSGQAAREADLARYAERLRTLERTEPIFFHPRDDFGADWRLKPGIAPRTVGQRR